jgi:hypothetical protein
MASMTERETQQVERASASAPDVFARKTLGQIADHTAEVIGELSKKPAVLATR